MSISAAPDGRNAYEALDRPALIAAVLLVSGCTAARQDRLYLYGEFHANDELLQRELALWKDYYAGGMRDLFVELPYYTAQYLNRWMQADNDRILMEVYTDWKGSASYHQNVLDFYRGIKEACPETVFHGTDVGHQYGSTGYRYLKLLRSEGKRDTEEYRLASENIDQGLEFYRTQDGEFRENARRRTCCGNITRGRRFRHGDLRRLPHVDDQ